jgi:hypothetical protein
MITTKTVDLLANMAHRLNAISSAVYEQGWREEAREIEAAAYRLAMSAASIDVKIAAGAAAMLKDEPA